MKIFMRIISVALITALLVTGLPVNVPFFGPQRAAADPGTYIEADPQQFSPARGESTEVSWDYDYGHPTLIEISRGGTLVYSYSDYFGGGDNYWTWDGCDSSGAIVPDGSYLVKVIPDDEFRRYWQSTNVYVYNPPPSTPTVGVSIDDAGNLVAGGTGDPGSGISVYTDNVRSGSTSVNGSGSWQVPLNVTPDTVHTVAAVASSAGKSSDMSTPERFLQHEIAPGEVLSQTADHYYMTGGDTSAIRNANSGVDIRPGTSILIPNPVVGGAPTATKTVPPVTGSGFGPFSRAGKTVDPINTSTGAFLFDRVDLVVPGKPDLVVRRSYTSGDPYEGPLGFGWHFTFDVRAVLNADDSIDIFRETGARDRFIVGTDGKYRPEQPGVFDKLERKTDGTVTLEMQDRTVQVFNADGLLTEIRDRNGNKIRLEYEDGYRLRRVANTTGQYLIFDYDDDARIKSVVDSAGRHLGFGYTGRDLTSITMPDNGAWSYAYDAGHRLTSATGPLGHVYVTNEYDADGRVFRQTDSLGNITNVEYDRAHLRTIFTDGSGTETIDTYDEFDRLVHRTDALGRTEYYTYNDTGSLESYTDGNGRTTFYYYDEGRLALVRDPLGAETTFHYDDRGDLREVIDHVGRKSVMTYDGAGNVKTIADPTGAVTSFDYDALGNLLKLTNAIGEWSDYTYDQSGRLDALTDALGNAFGFTHDAAGNLTGTSGPGGMSTESVSDWAGRPLTVTDALGNATSFVYDIEGNLKTMTDASGAVYAFDYDLMGNVRQITDPLGQVTAFEYDGSGRVKKMTAPGDAVTEYEYDAAGQLSRVTDPLGAATAFEHDGVGNITTITDAKQGKVSIEYDALNRPMNITDQRGGIARLEYDTAGRLQAEIDQSGARTIYEYDDADRVTAVIDAVGNRTETEYDLAGNPHVVTLPTGGKYQYEYRLGNMVAVTDPFGNTTRFERDAYGNVTDTIDANGTTTHYDYDLLGRVTQITDALGQVTSYDYDALGNVERIVDAKNRATAFNYDDIGRLREVIDALGSSTTYDYNAFGLTTAVDANGNATAYDLDALGQVRSVTDALGQVTAYDYDSLGNLIAQTDPDGRVTAFDYDATNLLKTITYADGGVVAYEYDEVGRPLKVTGPEGTNQYFYDAVGQITATIDSLARRTTYTYGPAGRTGMTSFNGLTVAYGYDEAGRLASITDWDSNTVSFAYDAVGRLVAKSLPDGMQTDYTWDDLGQLTQVATYDGAANLLTGFAYQYDAVGNTVLRQVLGELMPADPEEEQDPTGDGVAGAGADLSGSDVTGPEKGKSDKSNGKGNGAGDTTADTAATSGTGPFDAGLPKVSRPEPAMTAYEYDALDRLVKATDMQAGGNITETRDYVYDSVGNRLALTASGPDAAIRESISYAYDAANRLLSLTKSNGEAQSFEYDPLGNLTAIFGTDPADGTDKQLASYTYDIANRLIAFADSRGQEAQFAYDPEGRRVQRTQTVLWRGPGKGNAYAYGHDHAPGQQDDFTPPGQAGKENKETGSGGVNRSIRTPEAGVLIAEKPADPPGQGKQDNGAGNGAGEGAGNAGGSNDNGSSGGNGSINGNGSGNGNGNGNDAAGDKLTGQDKEKNQGQGNGNGQGNAYGKGGKDKGDNGKGTGQEGPKYYTEILNLVNDLASPLGEALAAYDETGAFQFLNLFVPGGDLLRTGSAEDPQWVLSDAIGSVTGLVAGDGKLTRIAYDEFGQPQSERRFDPTYPQGYSYFGFTGEPYDISTGFTYLRNRQYAPSLGRFTSPDPLGAAVGDPMSMNAYMYALSNPLSWIDPLGLSPVDASPVVAPSSEAKINTSFLGGFVKGVVKTAAVAAVGIIAAATAPVATAVVGTGLAVYGTITNYQQRAAEQVAAGQKVNKVGTFFAALGDTLGVTGVIEGITGRRLLTGKQLTSSQAGESLGSGVASVAAIVAGPALVKTIQPVVSKITGSIKNAIGSLFSKVAPATQAVAAPAAEASGASKPLYRYMSGDEVKAVQETGYLRGGRPDRTYWTDSSYRHAETAAERLSLKTEPQYRVEFEIANSPRIEGGTRVNSQYGRAGGGREYWSPDPVKVRLINAQPIGVR